ncbi:MAG: serine/threonine protein kinase [Paracoccaceae bacterium]
MSSVQTKPPLEDEDDNFVDELKPGTELLHGQYRIESFLNAGGFGITYLARDSLDRKIVIKECFPGAFCRRSTLVVQARSRAHQNELASIVRLFVQEARSLAKLVHPNIVGVHQVFEDNDTAYMALDFVEGNDLLEVLEDSNTTLSSSDIEDMLRKLLDAVAFIHKEGMLHRDISPDNILIDANRNPILIDFGAAREQASKQSRVLSALRVVKDGYSPQEFYIAGSEQGPSSDLYALAASFYHIITGEAPPNSQSRLAAIASGEKDSYVPLVGKVKGYEKGFLAAIDKAAAVLPKDRMQSAQEWLDALDGKSPVAAAVESTAAAAAASKPASEKPKMALILGSVAVIGLVAAGAITVMMSGDDTQQTAAAVTAEPTAPAPAETPDTSTAEVATPAEEVQSAEAVPTEEIEVVEAAPEIDLPKPDAQTTLGVNVEVSVPSDTNSSTDIATTDGPGLPEISTPELAEAAELDVVTVTTQTAEPPVTEEPAPEDVQTAAAAPTPDTTPSAENAPSNDPETASANQAPLEASAVMTGWSIQLPFEADESDATRIGALTSQDVPEWMIEGQSVVAVNGTPIDNFDEIGSIIRNAMDTPTDPFVTVSFGTGYTADGALIEEQADVAVVQETILLNGTSFQSQMVSGEWRTTVASVAEQSQDGFARGDQIVAYIPTSELIDGRTTLQTILERELAAGVEQFSFAVQRDGAMWVSGMQYSDDLSN